MFLYKCLFILRFDALVLSLFIDHEGLTNGYRLFTVVIMLIRFYMYQQHGQHGFKIQLRKQ